MHFEENQLSPNLIGLSPLPTGHPETFQRLSVRTSITYYSYFILPMDRSSGFGSTTYNLRPIKTRFPYGCAYLLNLAAYGNSQAHYAKGTTLHH